MSSVPFRNALVVANPVAGRGRARAAAEELASALDRAGVRSELFFTGARGDARKRAGQIDADFDLAVSVGGDGTLGEVLAGLADRDGRGRREGRGDREGRGERDQREGPLVPVAIFPFGTANVMSLDLGLPRDVGGIVEAIVRGRTVPLDTARVNGSRLSFLVTSVGFDAFAVHELEKKRRGPITKTAYFTAGLRALAHYARPSLAVELDGQELPGRFALVLTSNIFHYGGYKVLSDDCRIDDGLYEVYLFAKGSRASLLGYAIRALVAGLPGGSCTRVRARRIRITAEAATPCQVDGDAFGETPVEIVVDPVQSRLVVP